MRASVCDVLPGWVADLGCDARFNTYLFIFLFLPIVLLGYWAVPNTRWKLIWLTVTSAVFYGFWDIRFFALIAAAAIVDFWVALQLDRHERHRKAWLLISLLFNLGILAIFKYTIFATVNANSLFAFFGTDYRFPIPRIILPLGISFFTFKTMSYTIDVYRRNVAVCRDPLKYFAFVSMFPELVLGPIVRFSTMSDQLDRIPHKLPWNEFAAGLTCFAVGLFKKTIVSDLLASKINPLWAQSGSIEVADSWAAALGYTLQLYFDFSGYSDMAMGLGAMLALRFPINFNAPFQAVNPSDLWRRWHIGLTTWIRDYVYISLGGNRVAKSRFYFNLLLTVMLAALWHGAGWTFVALGLVQGTEMIIYHANRDAWARWPIWFQRFMTLFMWVTALVVLRAKTILQAGQLYAGMIGLHGLGSLLPALPLLVILAGLMAFCLIAKPLADWKFSFNFWKAGYVAGMLAISLLMLGRVGTTFLYYQF